MSTVTVDAADLAVILATAVSYRVPRHAAGGAWFDGAGDGWEHVLGWDNIRERAARYDAYIPRHRAAP